MRAFAHPDFRIVWPSYMVAQTGFWGATVTMQSLVVRLSGNDPLGQGGLFFFTFLPLLVLSPLGGVLADRADRRRLTVACQAATAVIAALLALLTASRVDSLAALYAGAFVLGTATAIGGPVGQAIVADSVPLSDLPSAMALQSAGINLARVAGPALVVPLTVAWGPWAAFGVYALAAGITSLMLLRLRAHVRVAPSTHHRSWRGWLFDLRDGLSYARRTPPVLAVVSMVAVCSICLSSYVVLLPVFAYDVLEGGAATFGAIVIATGIGAFMGALSTGVGEGEIRLRRCSALALCLGVALATLTATRDFHLFLLVAAVTAACNFALMTSLASLLQFLVDDAHRGRVMSLYLIAWGGLLPIGGLVMGALAHDLGAPATLLVTLAIGSAYAAAVGLRHRDG